MTYAVYSKSKNGNWVIERSYEAKIYAQQHADAINKGTDRKAKIVKTLRGYEEDEKGFKNRNN